ncbi:MAG: formate dehydrogenase accessory sulfurtransferase FdhD [Vicinamibacterales bacterium]
MPDSQVRVAPLVRVGPAGRAAVTGSDLVAVEEPLQLEIVHGPATARARLNAGVVLRTPGRDEDLATGLLFAEGFIRGADAIDRFDIVAPGHLRISLQPGVTLDDRLARRVLVRSGACGLCGRDAIDDLAGLGAQAAPGGAPISSALIRSLPALLRERQQVFHETGGLHAAAFIDASGAVEAIAEDIGRHNAVDKLVGARLRAASGAASALVIVSGRAAFEIVHKAVMARVAVLASVGAPSSLAVETARAFNLTLIGFLRDDRFNIYSGFDRIV